MVARNDAPAFKSEPRDNLVYQFLAEYDFKYISDIGLAALALIFLSPLLLIAALAIRLDSKGPAIFKQTRTGLRGFTFEIYKFRTMSVLENGPSVQQATTDDKRVTRIGRWLRRTSIDELPQLLNVIRGEMSLVGPRPHALAHDQYYGQNIPDYSGRFAVRPGITGWAQVNGSRGETRTIADMQRRIELDLWYVRNRSCTLDFRVLMRTIVLEIAHRGRGC
ncbi:exopolysaccharide biosynthesis polyprenyl glycosylphosphotransferase [Microvirga sp.]|uniref:exopolysaccharide biosynthesis polyprenyl glycosylphosphotransferase n=1 Tax=Microvirga sp. TaxID=1873136 RepID=UPI001FEEA286|nr:exopolysaccharide biosynthesis polyprenyl glycosylphosphotransferase [Microvirga sp.]